MKIHTKTALILLSTLILGVLLGTLISGPLLFRQHALPHARMKLTDHFMRHFEHLIDPDEAQRDTVRAILKRHAERFADMNVQHHAEVTTLMDSLHLDLSSILTEEQIEGLRDRLEHRPRWREGGPRRFRDRRP